MSDDAALPEGYRVPQGYKAYPAIERHCLKEWDGSIMESLFADPGERARARNAISQICSEIIREAMPWLLQPNMVNTPLWNAILATTGEIGARAMALGVYLGQTGLAKMDTE